MTVFDRRSKKIQRDWAARLPDSQHFDYLREEVAKRVGERLDDIPNHKFPVALDLGSGPGTLLKHIKGRGGIKTVYQLDSSEAMLYRDIKPNQTFPDIDVRRICADEESIPLEANSVDIVLSSMSLHWINDLPGVFNRIRKVLKPDGVFIAALLGGDTLKELRDSFTLAEQERRGGVGTHISPMTAVGDVGNLLTAAGFSLPTVDTESFTIKYADPFVLMRELQCMGESNANIDRGYISKEILFAAASTYQSLFGNSDGTISATYQVIYCIGWAPHHSQPKPKQRGSAEYSLKDLGKMAGKPVQTLLELDDDEEDDKKKEEGKEQQSSKKEDK